MATCEDLVKGAFRRAGITRDLDEVRPREMARGLQVLSDLYLELVAAGSFGRVRDVLVEDDYTATEGDRILVTTEDDVTITLPETIEDECATDGVRAPRDGALIMITDVASTDRRTFIYDSAYAAWTALENLALGDWAPLSGRYRSGLEARLATRLAEENGKPVTAEMRRQEGQGMRALLMRYDSPERPVETCYF